MLRIVSMTLSLACYLSAINRVDAAPITTISEAMVYLARFGYLDPKYENSSYSSVLSAKSISNVIEEFQLFAGLNKTGKLDAETLKLMNTPRCGVPDRIPSGSTGSSIRQNQFTLQGSRWSKKQLTYKITKYATNMERANVDREIARAFQVWADVTDLTFVHLSESSNVDIEILFGYEKHGDCPHSFENEVLAHAYYPQYGGDAHFYDKYKWTLNSDEGINLFQVATHEFGHSLGLKHSDVTTAVMHPTYEKYDSNFKLDQDDIEGIQELYSSPLEKLATKLKVIQKELENTNAVVDDLKQKLNARTREIVDIGKMPTSCGDLQRMGHKLSGFFSVQGLEKIEIVFCDFFPNQNDLQKDIGYADIKSSSVHFYVQRSYNFNAEKTRITFDWVRLNEGNAMDITSGIFTAPRPGIYFFSFTGLANFPSTSSFTNFGVSLYLNGIQIGTGFTERADTSNGENDQVTLQSTLKLKSGDRVWLETEYMSHLVFMIDNNDSMTHFVGFMLEEEIVASL